MTNPPLLVVVGMNSEVRPASGLGTIVVGVNAAEEAIAMGVGGVLSFGLCGALDPKLRPGDLVIGVEVHFGDEAFICDANWSVALQAALPAARLGRFAGSDRIVASQADKAALAAATGAVAVDMESHAVARCATRAGIPFAILRAVSDAAALTLPRAAQAGFRPDGRVDVVAVLRALASRPSELPALVRTGRDAGAAMNSLRDAAGVLRGLVVG